MEANYKNKNKNFFPAVSTHSFMGSCPLPSDRVSKTYFVKKDAKKGKAVLPAVTMIHKGEA